MKNTTEIKRAGGKGRKLMLLGLTKSFPARWEIKLIVCIVLFQLIVERWYGWFGVWKKNK